MKTLNQETIFLNVCKNALNLQDKLNGAMPGGHNGPYYHEHTPIRNTSHWAISFLKAYKITGDANFKLAGKKCLDYLLNNNEYRTKYTFVHRLKEGIDKENGTIGTAWNIEALVIGFQILNKKEYLELAIELYKVFKFNKKKGLWYRISPEGVVYEIDKTFNHQLWFAMSALFLYDISHQNFIKNDVDIFMRKIDKYFKTSKNGRIRHSIYTSTNIKSCIKTFLLKGIYSIRHIFKGLTYEYKENGYHLFNLYAFAVIRDLGYYEEFFSSKKFLNTLNYAFKKEFFNKLLESNHSIDITKLKIKVNLPFNRYGYGYNGPGFEIPYIEKVFSNVLVNPIESSLFWQKQLEYTYNELSHDFSINTDDPITLTARIYELSRVL